MQTSEDITKYIVDKAAKLATDAALDGKPVYVDWFADNRAYSDPLGIFILRAKNG